MSSNYESTALLSPIPPKRKTKGNSAQTCLFIVVLLVLAGATLFMNARTQRKTAMLTTQLEHVLKEQQYINSRFNSSVTNSDVLAKVDALKADLITTEENMNEKLLSTTNQINLVLQKTLKDLNVTIADAETVIRAEVSEVKSDISTYVQKTEDQFSTENDFMKYQLAGTFTLLGCLISMWHMTDHLRHMYSPDVQRKVLAILWMSPIYSITSWFGLVFSSAEVYLGIIKDLYEAYCIYMFLAFIIAVLGRGDRDAVITKLALHADHLTPPIQVFGYPKYSGSSRAKAGAVLLQCQAFTMQFVFFHPFTAIVKLVCDRREFYGFGTSAGDWRSPQFFMTVIDNISIFMAFSGLLKTYHAVQHDLAWYRPLPKFLCIKGVVFMTFWQGMMIRILTNLSDGNSEDSKEKAARTQSFLICLEMLGFSIAHFYTFPVGEWKPDYRPVENTGKFGDNMALGDFLSDLRLVMGVNTSKKSKADDGTDSSSNGSSNGSSNEDLENGDTGHYDAAHLAPKDYTPSRKKRDKLTNSGGVTKRLLSISGSVKSSQVKDAAHRMLSSRVLSALEDDEVASLTRDVPDSPPASLPPSPPPSPPPTEPTKEPEVCVHGIVSSHAPPPAPVLAPKVATEPIDEKVDSHTSNVLTLSAPPKEPTPEPPVDEKMNLLASDLPTNPRTATPPPPPTEPAREPPVNNESDLLAIGVLAQPPPPPPTEPAPEPPVGNESDLLTSDVPTYPTPPPSNGGSP